jgi:ABC-2 type transport system ATP-binding protein
VDRAAIIKDGIIIAVKDIHELQSMQRKVFEVTFENTGDIPAFMNSSLQIESRTDNRVKVAVLGNHDQFIKETAKYHIRHIDASSQSLEEIFMNYYNRKGTAQ